MPDEGNVGGQSRNALIDVLKGLQVGHMHHEEEGLLEGIAYFGGHLQDDPKQLFDTLRQGDSVSIRSFRSSGSFLGVAPRLFGAITA